MLSVRIELDKIYPKGGKKDDVIRNDTSSQ